MGEGEEGGGGRDITCWKFLFWFFLGIGKCHMKQKDACIDKKKEPPSHAPIRPTHPPLTPQDPSARPASRSNSQTRSQDPGPAWQSGCSAAHP